jgi:sensor histidine kinase YesM
LSLFDKYKDKLPLFWQRSEQKNINYWYINEFMTYNELGLFFHKRFQKKFSEVAIPWDKPFTKTLNPSVDYLYSSEEHIKFILLYSKYRQKQLLSVNAALESIDLKEQYTLNKIIYSGYPMYLAMAYNLITILAHNSNSIEKVNEFYNEFISYCEDPLFVKSIKDVYENIDSIQPGKNITDIDLYFTDKLNLQNVATSYILFSVSDFKHTNVLLSMLNTVLQKYKFKNISVVIIKPYSLKQTDKLKNFTGAVRYYYSSKDSVAHDTKKLLTFKNEMMLIRNDGVIISNRVSDFEKTFSHLPQRPPTHDLTGYYKVIFIVFFSVLFAVLITIFSIRYRNVRILKREEAKRRLAELELKAIRSQMNPHFMFNSLNSIQNLINKNRIKEANLYLSRFANMMRMVLNNSDKPLVPLDEEIQLIKTYLELEQLRIQFNFNINISDELTPEEEEIPGMLIQPFVENAVIHGVAPNRGGNISVDILKNESRLKIEIVDDGIGINERSAQKGNGKAMKMVEERIKILNSRNRIPLTVDVIDLKETENGLGTKVIITIPV